MAKLATPTTDPRSWHRHDQPRTCWFVMIPSGPHSSFDDMVKKTPILTVHNATEARAVALAQDLSDRCNCEMAVRATECSQCDESVLLEGEGVLVVTPRENAGGING